MTVSFVLLILTLSRYYEHQRTYMHYSINHVHQLDHCCYLKKLVNLDLRIQFAFQES